MRRLPLATAGREGRLVCRSHAPPVGGRLTERKWQPPAGRAGLFADLMRRLLAGALQRDLMRRLLAGALQREPAAAGREGRLVCRSHAPPVCVQSTAIVVYYCRTKSVTTRRFGLPEDRTLTPEIHFYNIDVTFISVGSINWKQRNQFSFRSSRRK